MGFIDLRLFVLSSSSTPSFFDWRVFNLLLKIHVMRRFKLDISKSYHNNLHDEVLNRSDKQLVAPYCIREDREISQKHWNIHKHVRKIRKQFQGFVHMIHRVVHLGLTVIEAEQPTKSKPDNLEVHKDAQNRYKVVSFSVDSDPLSEGFVLQQTLLVNYPKQEIADQKHNQRNY